MSRLSDLMEELCPAGVPIQALGQLATRITDGSHNPPRASVDGLYPMLSARNIARGRLDLRDARMLSEADFMRENARTAVQEDDVLLTIVGAIGRVAVVETSDPLVFQRSVCVIKPRHDVVSSRFIRYALESSALQTIIAANANGAAQKGLYLHQVAQLRLPVPPIEVQREIVRVLDTFIDLDAQLEAESEARRSQHAHVRANMLMPRPGVDLVPLSELVAYVRGVTYSKGDEQPGGPVQVLRANNISLETNTLNFAEVKRVASTVRVRPDQRLMRDDILISAASGSRAHVGKVAYSHEDTPYVFGGFMAAVRAKERLDSRYLFHLLADQAFSEYLRQTLNSTTINNLTSALLGAYRVPLPPIAEQRRIALTLDRFDLLVNDDSSGLPAERFARLQQYQHYRDRLLTFEELAA